MLNDLSFYVKRPFRTLSSLLLFTLTIEGVIRRQSVAVCRAGRCFFLDSLLLPFPSVCVCACRLESHRQQAAARQAEHNSRNSGQEVAPLSSPKLCMKSRKKKGTGRRETDKLPACFRIFLSPSFLPHNQIQWSYFLSVCRCSSVLCHRSLSLSFTLLLPFSCLESLSSTILSFARRMIQIVTERRKTYA